VSRALPFVLLALLAAPALGQDEARDDVWSDAYATVGSATILRDRVKAETKRGTLAQALQRLIHVEFMVANLGHEGVDPAAISDAELQEGIDEATARISKSGATFEQILERTGQTQAQFRATFRVSYALMRLVRSRVTEEETRELYAAHALRLKGEVRASHILVAVSAKRNDAAAKARAKELHAKLAPAKAAELETAFAKLASEASDDAMAALSGGDLDWFSGRGRPGLPMRVAIAAFDHGKTGLLPEPVRGGRGWHVVLVTGVNLPEDATYEALHTELRDRAAAVRAERLLAGWKTRTPIRYAPDAPKDR
jgi:parvulin-like peptidyl-prolyl isomerase